MVRGTGDARLVAYDARTGREVWRVKAGDPEVGEYISAAPVSWDGKIFVGLAGGDWGIQGRMMAFDARSWEKVWTFNLIPHPGEYGNDTWPGETWQRGGGVTWSSYTLDGNVSRSTWPQAAPGTPNVIIYAVGDGSVASTAKPKATTSEAGATGNAARGAAAYATVCAGCHGKKGEGLVGPSLKGSSAKYDYGKMVAYLKKPAPAMPTVYPHLVDERELHDIAAFVRIIQ